LRGEQRVAVRSWLAGKNGGGENWDEEEEERGVRRVERRNGKDGHEEKKRESGLNGAWRGVAWWLASSSRED
jgi:hypothetical protein